MSNRSLVEFNHDYTGDIERDPEGFLQAILLYLRSGQAEEVSKGRREIFRGIRVFGMRHHSDGFAIEWGGHIVTEQESSKR